MRINLTLQLATIVNDIPAKKQFRQWLRHTLIAHYKTAAIKVVEVCIRLVDETESAKLNQTYRGKAGATNILSFPFTTPSALNLTLLGDLVICAPCVIQEAQQQHKLASAHWAHLTVHGMLHLLGYDHVIEEDALVMESLEIAILDELGIADPYHPIDNFN